MSKIILTCEDNMRLMSRYPDNYFHLAVVDPNYGIKENAHRNNQSRSKLAKPKKYRNVTWDQPPPTDEYFRELFRVSKNQVIWGGNYFLDYLPATRCMLIWDKVNGNSHFADVEIAWTSFQTSSRLFRFVWNGMCQGQPGNGAAVQGDKSLNQNRIHECEKPIPLYRWIFKNYVKPGQRILDTHLGSGASARAAYDLDLSLYGCEIDPEHYSNCMEAFDQHRLSALRNPKLPFTEPIQLKIS